jgi:hypothetical protein
MKKIKLGIFTILLLTGVFVIIFSCKKEKIEEDDKTQNQTEQSLNDVQLEKKIIAFRDKIDLIRKNPTLKSGSDPMEIDSAIWYIEATSNLTYGDASMELDGVFVIDSSTIEVPVTNGQILWIDVQAAYDQTIDSLSAHNTAITANEKQLLAADISLKDTNANTATFTVTSGFGTDGTSGLGMGNDYPWYWGWELGRCDGSGLGVGFDAADKIAQLANYFIVYPGGNAYYTDVEWRASTGCEHASYTNVCLFEDYQEYTLVHQCLSTTEISSYKNNLITIGNYLKPTPDHSVFKYYLVDWTAFGILPGGGDYWAMSHHTDIKYGIWHVSSDPPNDL